MQSVMCVLNSQWLCMEEGLGGAQEESDRIICLLTLNTSIKDKLEPTSNFYFCHTYHTIVIIFKRAVRMIKTLLPDRQKIIFP